MVWQLVVLPGTHSVTLTNNVFALLFSGPESTVTAATLEPLTVVVPPEPEPATSSPPPPQELARIQAIRQRPALRKFMGAPLILVLPRSLRSELPEAGRRCR